METGTFIEATEAGLITSTDINRQLTQRKQNREPESQALLIQSSDPLVVPGIDEHSFIRYVAGELPPSGISYGT